MARGKATPARARAHPPATSRSRIRAPEQSRSAHTVQAILDATHELVQSTPLRTLTVNAIARRAGVSPGSIYQYFRSREAILAAWELRELERRFAPAMAELAATFHTMPPIETVVAGFAKACIQIMFEHCERYGSDTADLVSTMEERLRVLDTHVEAIADMMEIAVERHRVRPKKIRLAVRVICAAITFGVHALATRKPTKAEQLELAEEMSDMAVRHLLT